MPQTSMMEPLPGLTYQKARGDGHCFYHAVLFYLDGMEVSTLRHLLADTLLENKMDYEDLILALRPEETFESYTKKLRQNEWADDLEVTLLTRVLQRPILVLMPNGELRHTDAVETYPDADPIFVRYNGTNHYDALTLAPNTTGRSVFESYQASTRLIKNNEEPIPEKTETRNRTITKFKPTAPIKKEINVAPKVRTPLKSPAVNKTSHYNMLFLMSGMAITTTVVALACLNILSMGVAGTILLGAAAIFSGLKFFSASQQIDKEKASSPILSV